MNTIVKIAFISFLFALAGCATPPDAPFTEAKSMAVISAVGDKIKVYSVGTTVFQNATTDGELDQFAVDELVADEIKTLLADQYNFVAADYDRDAIRSDYETDLSKFWSPEFDFAGSLKRNVAKPFGGSDALESEAFDSYILVVPAAHNNYGVRGAPRLVGPGMYSTSLFGGRNTYLYFGAQLIIVDAQTYEEQRRRLLMPGYNNLPTENKKCASCYFRNASNDLYAKTFEELTDAQKQEIASEITILIKDSVRNALALAGLIPTPETDAD